MPRGSVLPSPPGADGQLIAEGLLCRADDRGEPVIQLSPPLIAGPEEFEEITRMIRIALLDAMDAMGR